MKKNYATPILMLLVVCADVITASEINYVKTNDFDAGWLTAGSGN